MTRDQRIVATGAIGGVLGMAAAMAALWHFLPAPTGLDQLSARLGYTLIADALAVIPMLLGIVAVGNGRAMSEAIDPTLHKESRSLLIDGRVADNSHQQLSLFMVATLALAVTLTGPEMRLVLAGALVHVVTRLLFWIGYRIHPLYRAFGMAATIYLNLGLLGFALWRGVPLLLAAH
jgi:uncharacterized MAPEG superfamily protein